MLEALSEQHITVPDSWRVRTFGCVDSTNRVVKDALRSGEPQGLCVTALKQNGGYGRQGRVWESPVGGLYTSFALCPKVSPQKLSSLSLVVSVAVHRTLRTVCDKALLAIKWPNDVLCAAGKIAGISLEALSQGVCVGVGINVFPRTEQVRVLGKYHLSYVSDQPVNEDFSPEQRELLERILGALIHEINQCYEQWCAEGFSPFVDEYRSHLAYLNSEVEMERIDGSTIIEGILRGVDDEGHLLVQTESRQLCAVSTGEVHITALTVPDTL